MILSASRRTDIPAWHADWLLEGLRRGWIETSNPFRPTQLSRVSLRRDDVDAMVFWTRDVRPLLPHLQGPELAPVRSLFLYTITGYGPDLEPGVPPPEVAVGALRELSSRVGARRVIWRYDPVILGEGVLSPQAHRARFEALAAALSGSTTRVVISLLDWYRKTSRALAPHRAGRRPPTVRPCDADDPELLDLVRDLCDLAYAQGIEAVGCCEPEWARHGVLPAGACIDAALLDALWGLAPSQPRDRGQRAACRCAPSRDIGRYDTCEGGCRYCYATLARPSKCP